MAKEKAAIIADGGPNPGSIATVAAALLSAAGSTLRRLPWHMSAVQNEPSVGQRPS